MYFALNGELKSWRQMLFWRPLCDGIRIIDIGVQLSADVTRPTLHRNEAQ
jgi:hypothetical protein